MQPRRGRGVTSLACPPDTDSAARRAGARRDAQIPRKKPEPGARITPSARSPPGSRANGSPEMAELRTRAAWRSRNPMRPSPTTTVLAVTMEYASTFGFSGVAAAAGPGARRPRCLRTTARSPRGWDCGDPGMRRDDGALHHMILARETGARVHLCRLPAPRR